MATGTHRIHGLVNRKRKSLLNKLTKQAIPGVNDKGRIHAATALLLYRLCAIRRLPSGNIPAVCSAYNSTAALV